MCLLVSPNHALAAKALVEWPVVRSERLLILKEGHCFRDQVLTTCSRRSADVRAIFDGDQFSSILIGRFWFGVSIIPEMAADVATGCRVVRLGPASVRKVGYFRNRRSYCSKAAKACISWLRTVAQKHMKS
jgi:LysR family hydrogen peroxide-inducible transcriptional activator